MSSNLLAQDNHLFNLARKGQVRWPQAVSEKLYAVVALLFGLLVPVIAQIIGVIPLVLFVGFERVIVGQAGILLPFDPNVNTAIFLSAIFAPIFLLLWGWLRFFERRPFWTLGLEGAGWWWKYGRGVVVGSTMISAALALLALSGSLTFEVGSPRPHGLAALDGILIILLGWIVQGAAEEVLTRGFLLPVTGIRFGTVAGIILSSLLFALFHVLNPHVNLIPLLNVFLFGVFAALYAIYEGGLWGILAIHSAWNWAQGNLYGLEVSGMEQNVDTLLDLEEVGPDWLTGGTFGPEGGLAVSLVLVMSSLLVWVAHRHRLQRSTE